MQMYLFAERTNDAKKRYGGGMADRFNQILGSAGVNPIVATGESVVNVAVDEAEWVRRPVIDGDRERAANVYSRELIFARKHQTPSQMLKKGLQDSHVLVFAGFNGALNHADDEFVFVGLARNSPEHQNRNGPLGHQFAAQIGGTNTILCRSANSISKFATIAWRSPRNPDVPIDGTGDGRLLAEIYEYEPGSSMIRPHNIHAIISRQVMTRDTSRLTEIEKARAIFPMKLWEVLRSIGYSFALAFMAADSIQKDLVPVSAAEKLRVAQVFGLTSSTTLNPGRQNEVDLRRMKFEQQALDAVFQLTYNPKTQTSAGAANLAAFTLQPAGTAVPNQREQDVARKQASQLTDLSNLFIKMYAREQDSIIGVALNGGFPGRDMDVSLRNP